MSRVMSEAPWTTGYIYLSSHVAAHRTAHREEWRLHLQRDAVAGDALLPSRLSAALTLPRASDAPQAEANGLCLYWGYMLRSATWHTFIGALRNLSSGSRLPHVCIEAHTGIEERTPWLERLRQIEQLRAIWRERSLPIRVVLLLRLREPLDHYISFFLWAMAERQDKDPAKYGSRFEEWVRRVPNLQSELILSSRAAGTAVAPAGHRHVLSWGMRWGSDQAIARRSALVWQTVRKFDVRLLLSSSPAPCDAPCHTSPLHATLHHTTTPHNRCIPLIRSWAPPI